jgi:hypothetical protein
MPPANLDLMTRKDFYGAVLVFLDQFIGRGAAPDIKELRARLTVEEDARKELKDYLPSDDVSEREAFDAMRAFLQAEHERHPQPQHEGVPDLVDLLSWTRWESANEKGHFDDAGSLQMTGDPAQWHDWVKSVEAARTSS